MASLSPITQSLHLERLRGCLAARASLPDINERVREFYQMLGQSLPLGGWMTSILNTFMGKKEAPTDKEVEKTLNLANRMLGVGSSASLTDLNRVIEQNPSSLGSSAILRNLQIAYEQKNEGMLVALIHSMTPRDFQEELMRVVVEGQIEKFTALIRCSSPNKLNEDAVNELKGRAEGPILLLLEALQGDWKHRNLALALAAERNDVFMINRMIRDERFIASDQIEVLSNVILIAGRKGYALVIGAICEGARFGDSRIPGDLIALKPVIMEAARAGSLKVVKSLLNSRMHGTLDFQSLETKLEFIAEHLGNAFTEAAGEGLTYVLTALQHSINIHPVNIERFMDWRNVLNRALEQAASSGHLDVMSFLLNHPS